MEAEEMEILRARLQSLLGNISGDVSSSLSQLSSESSSHHLADLDDLASDASVEDVLHARFATSDEALKEIDRALQKLESGSYGSCDDCQGDIGSPRLEAIPFATLCVTCKAKLERRNSG